MEKTHFTKLFFQRDSHSIQVDRIFQANFSSLLRDIDSSMISAMECKVTGQDMGYAPDTQGGHGERGKQDGGKKLKKINPKRLKFRF